MYILIVNKMYKFTYILLILFNITLSSIDKMIRRISHSAIGKMFIMTIKWFKKYIILAYISKEWCVLRMEQ